MAALVAFRIKPSRDRRVTKFARRAVEDAKREVEHRRRASMDDPAALHDLRIAYKRLRYTVEVFDSVLPPELLDLAQTATRMQNRLGRLHDVDLAIAAVKGARQLLDVAREALLAALQRVRKERVAAFEHGLSGAQIRPSPVKVRHAENGAGRASSA
jgi:CHAD domain-containing protein